MTQSATVEQVLVVGAVALLVASQAAVWWRCGQSAPQAAWMAAFTQGTALAVLALRLDQAGLRLVAGVLAVVAGTCGVGVVSAARSARRVARSHDTSWVRVHRRGLRSVLVTAEAVAVAVAVAVAISWAAEHFNGDFNGKADDSLCRLLDGAC
jgi:hypothetical protein